METGLTMRDLLAVKVIRRDGTIETVYPREEPLPDASAAELYGFKKACFVDCAEAKD